METLLHIQDIADELISKSTDAEFMGEPKKAKVYLEQLVRFLSCPYVLIKHAIDEKCQEDLKVLSKLMDILIEARKDLFRINQQIACAC